MILWWLGCGRVVSPEPAPEPNAVMVKPGRRDPKWASARCNDGTAFGYVVRKGTAPVWVINLTGGYFCDDGWARCADRKRRLTTTRPEADGEAAKIKSVGLFSIDRSTNPTFADATHVDAHYCSSDLWLGDSVERRPTTGDPDQGWYFSGRENFRVLLDALVAIDGLDEADPDTRILLLGTSAGGAGVVGNLDAVVAAFPTATADGRVKVVLDGSWVVPLPEGVGLPDGGRWGPIEPSCDRDHRARGEDPRGCITGPVWWPYAASRGIPMLIQISGLDESQTPVFGIDTPEELAAWQRTVRTSLGGVPWVFSGGNPYHVVAIEELFTKGPAGSTFREVLDRFWAGGPPEQVWFAYPE